MPDDRYDPQLIGRPRPRPRQPFYFAFEGYGRDTSMGLGVVVGRAVVLTEAPANPGTSVRSALGRATVAARATSGVAREGAAQYWERLPAESGSDVWGPHERMGRGRMWRVRVQDGRESVTRIDGELTSTARAATALLRAELEAWIDEMLFGTRLSLGPQAR